MRCARFPAATLLALLALTPAAAALAEAPPDPRIVSLPWSAGQRQTLPIVPGNSLTVMLASSEHVRSVTLDDPGSVQVTLSSSGDSFVIHTLRALPPTAMSVESDRRSYLFNLVRAGDGVAPYLVRMTYPAQVASPQFALSALPGSAALTGAQGSGAQAAGFSWRMSGAKALRPLSISDDGVHTYIRWAADQLIPAVFAVSDVGGEEMVDGYMRGDTFTIDRVNRRLVFRIDRASARALRKAAKARKP